MWKQLAVLVFCVASVDGCATAARHESEARIDSSSSQSAKDSYRAMMSGRSQADQQKLAIAVLVLNMQGVKSATEVVNNPELQAPSIDRIRAKVAGMTAEEIIALAAKNPSVRVDVTGN